MREIEREGGERQRESERERLSSSESREEERLYQTGLAVRAVRLRKHVELHDVSMSFSIRNIFAIKYSRLHGGVRSNIECTSGLHRFSRRFLTCRQVHFRSGLVDRFLKGCLIDYG